MDAIWSEFGTTGNDRYILGGSYSTRIYGGGTIYNQGECVWREDTNFLSGDYDTRIVYDVTAGGSSWNFGSNSPNGSQIDFRSVITHEIGHSLGFDTSYDSDYNDFGYVGSGYAGLTAWESHLIDSEGRRPISGPTPADPFDVTGNPVYWDGANAVALYGGNVPIYAPEVFSAGSSLSHLNEDSFARNTALMTPFIDNGEMIRAPSALEWAMMKDMGWNIVPEPSAWAMLIGLSGTWFFWRQRRCPSDR